MLTNESETVKARLLTEVKKWVITFNELKFIHLNYTNKRIVQLLPLGISSTVVLYEMNEKYLDEILGGKLRWIESPKEKKVELDANYREDYWIIGRGSKMAIQGTDL